MKNFLSKIPRKKLKSYYPRGRRGKKGYMDELGTYHKTRRSAAEANWYF